MNTLAQYRKNVHPLSRQEAMKILSNEKKKHVLSVTVTTKTVTPILSIIGNLPDSDDVMKLVQFTDHVNSTLRANNNLHFFLKNNRENPIFDIRHYLENGLTLPQDTESKLETALDNDAITMSILNNLFNNNRGYRPLSENITSTFTYERYASFLHFINFRDSADADADYSFTQEVANELYKHYNE
jgi:hypothetical protein